MSPKESQKGKYLRMLIAILLGNAIYFGSFPVLPEGLKHAPYKMDAGLLFDFLICVFLYLMINALTALVGARR
jgi:hypothetical protein